MEKTTDEKILELQKACMMLQGQIGALKTIIADLYKTKEDKKKPDVSSIIKPYPNIIKKN